VKIVIHLFSKKQDDQHVNHALIPSIN